MSLLQHGKRIYLDPSGADTSDWVEVRQLSIFEVRDFRQSVMDAAVLPGEEKAEAQGFEMARMVSESCIIAWSEDAPITPENVARLPFTLAIRIADVAGLGGGEEEPPLTSGSASNDSSAETPPQENQKST